MRRARRSTRSPFRSRADSAAEQLRREGGPHEAIRASADAYGLTIEGEPRVDRSLTVGTASRVGHALRTAVADARDDRVRARAAALSVPPPRSAPADLAEQHVANVEAKLQELLP
jgi:hypothetical protein